MSSQNSMRIVDKDEIKMGEDKLKSIIGGKILHDSEFIRLMKVNNISNTSQAWSYVNGRIRQELKQGQITYEDVPERVNQLVLMLSPNDKLVTLEEVDAVTIEKAKRKMLAKGKFNIQIPYHSSGISNAVIGQAVFGKSGAVLGAMSEGQTEWRSTDLIFINNGFTIKSTGSAVSFSDIKQAAIGDPGFIHTVISVLTHDGREIVFKAANLEAVAFFKIVNEYINEVNKKASSEDASKLNNNADVLLKYAELYEKGLLTREEFDEKKRQLMNNNVPDDSSADLPESTNHKLFCMNCGHQIDEDSNFCTYCGTKIK